MVNTPSSSEGFSPLSYENARAFLTDLQKFLEEKTGIIFKQRLIDDFKRDAHKKVETNEPEDLYTLSQVEQELYFACVQKSSDTWENEFKRAMGMAIEMAEGDPSEGTRIYLSALARILAQRSKVNNKASEEKLVDKILKMLLQRAPYFRHAFSLLMGAQAGVRMSALRKTVRETIEGIIWKDNKKGGLLKVAFGGAKRGEVEERVEGKDPIVIEKEEGNPEFEGKYNALVEVVKNTVDAHAYVEMLLGPINLHSTIKEQALLKILRNPGFESLCTILKDILKVYEEHPKRLLELTIVDMLRLLGNIEAIGRTASTLDSYEKKPNQYALVFLTERLIKELTFFYSQKLSGSMLEVQEVTEMLSNLLKLTVTVDRLTGKLDMVEPKDEGETLMIVPRNLENIALPKEFQIVEIPNIISEDQLRGVLTEAYRIAFEGFQKGVRVDLVLEKGFPVEKRQRLIDILREVEDVFHSKDTIESNMVLAEDGQMVDVGEERIEITANMTIDEVKAILTSLEAHGVDPDLVIHTHSGLSPEIVDILTVFIDKHNEKDKVVEEPRLDLGMSDADIIEALGTGATLEEGLPLSELPEDIILITLEMSLEEVKAIFERIEASIEEYREIKVLAQPGTKQEIIDYIDGFMHRQNLRKIVGKTANDTGNGEKKQ